MEPILILGLTGDCYGILQYFAKCLATSLSKMEIEVVTDVDYKEGLNIQEIVKRKWAAVIGMANPNLWNEWTNYLQCPKYQFWFDDPIFFTEKIQSLGKCTILTLDSNYVNYINHNFNLQRALLLPPGGNERFSVRQEKVYDVSFVGTYYPPSENLEYEQECFLQFLLQNKALSFEQAIEQFCQVDQKQELLLFQQIASYLHQACLDVAHYERQELIQILLNNEIEVHVFGESWKNFPTKSNFLVIHDEVKPQNVYHIYQKSKISLNVMTWHKAGMTERISEIMLSGAVCISDETQYLQTHFEHGKEILLFQLEKKEKCVEFIKDLLDNPQKREVIALNAYEKAKKLYTWDNVAKSLLEIMQNNC